MKSGISTIISRLMFLALWYSNVNKNVAETLALVLLHINYISKQYSLCYLFLCFDHQLNINE